MVGRANRGGGQIRAGGAAPLERGDACGPSVAYSNRLWRDTLSIENRRQNRTEKKDLPLSDAMLISFRPIIEFKAISI